MKRREKSFASGSVFCSSFSADLLSPWWWLLGMVLSYWSFVVCVWLNKYTHSTNINEDSNNDSLSVSHCPTRFSLSLSIAHHHFPHCEFIFFVSCYFLCVCFCAVRASPFFVCCHLKRWPWFMVSSSITKLHNGPSPPHALYCVLLKSFLLALILWW